MQDARLTTQLIKHWRRSKGERPLPAYEQFNAEALGSEFWQNCGVLSVRQSGNNAFYTVEYLGSGALRALGTDSTGQTVVRFTPDFAGARVLKRAGEALISREPITDEGHFVNKADKIVKFRACLLPFGLQESVSHLLFGLSWRDF